MCVCVLASCLDVAPWAKASYKQQRKAQRRTLEMIASFISSSCSSSELSSTFESCVCRGKCSAPCQSVSNSSTHTRWQIAMIDTYLVVGRNGHHEVIVDWCWRSSARACCNWRRRRFGLGLGFRHADPILCVAVVVRRSSPARFIDRSVVSTRSLARRALSRRASAKRCSSSALAPNDTLLDG